MKSQPLLEAVLHPTVHSDRILKVSAEVKENDPEMFAKLSDPDYHGKVERAFIFHLEAWDINCPQHIKPRFTEAEVGDTVEHLRERIRVLEERVKSCGPAE